MAQSLRGLRDSYAALGETGSNPSGSTPVTETGLTDAGDILVIASDTERALRTVILRKPTLCRDSMTGMPHPETVELSMGDSTIMGCGGDPWSLLVGRTWVVEDIGGAGVVDTARTTMGFDGVWRVYDSSSCNRYKGLRR